MTNKTAEQEAMETAGLWAHDYYFDENDYKYRKLTGDEEDPFSEVVMPMAMIVKAHMAGQSVGYARALEEVGKATAQYDGLDDAAWVTVRNIINNLKSKVAP